MKEQWKWKEFREPEWKLMADKRFGKRRIGALIRAVCTDLRGTPFVVFQAANEGLPRLA
jgi:hypothetical protein